MTPATSNPANRERILKLAREIEQISESDVPPSVFFARFLERLMPAVGARAAGAFLESDQALHLEQSAGFEELGVFRDPAIMRRNEPLLLETLQTGETKAIAADDPAVPTRHVYIMAAISRGKVPAGVLQVLLPPETNATAKAGILQFVEQMAGYASRYLSRPAAAPGATRPAGPEIGPAPNSSKSAPPTGDVAESGTELPAAFWRELESFLLQLERSRGVKEVSATAASDGRLLFGVDRVSIVRNRGRKTRVEAISGQDKVNPRANLVRRLAALCKVVMAGRDALVYRGNVDDMPPQLEKPLADYIAESKSRLVIVIPLRAPGQLIRPEFEDKEQDRARSHKEERVIGALVVEEINDSRIRPLLREKIDLTADHVAATLAQAITIDQIFLRRTLMAIGRTGEWFHGRKLAKTLAISSVVAAITLSMWLVPWPYKVVCDGQLMPITQRHVFAPWDGQVARLAVRGGEHVEKGDLLAVLVNDELRTELTRVENELAQRAQVAETLARRAAQARRRGSDQESQLNAERLAAEAEVRGLEKQLEILNGRFDRLRIVAPITGQVATFQLEQLLSNRPLQRGESLMEIMNDQGNWHLELNVENSRMGHINEAIAERKGDVGLPVEFVLATVPESEFQGTLSSIASRTHAEPELGNVVRVEVAIDDPAALPKRRIGTEVRAKINTGPAALGYVLFGDVIDFVRKHLWL